MTQLILEQTLNGLRVIKSFGAEAEWPHPGMHKGGMISEKEVPYRAATAGRLQQDGAAARGLPVRESIELGEDVELELTFIPEGSFVMGSSEGDADESPASVVKITRPFLIGTREITNRQFARFRPEHDSGFVSRFNKDHVDRGEAINRPDQPVMRVSWNDALDFCRWLSSRTGAKISLPEEAQWEYACRAGTASPLAWGDLSADFSKLANLADRRLNQLTIRDSPDWIPSIPEVDDKSVVTCDVGRYQANAWGLHDMHGNAAEWTLSMDQPYPYQSADGRNRIDDALAKRVLRGGSYYDRPHRARSAFRLAYPAWQRVYNAGFRVVMEIPEAVTRR